MGLFDLFKKRKPSGAAEVQRPTGPGLLTESVYMVRLYCGSSPPLPPVDLERRVQARMPRSSRMDKSDGQKATGSVVFAHHGVEAKFHEGSVPYQNFIAREDVLPDPGQLMGDVQQTWDWKGAAVALAQSRNSVLVADLFGAMVPRHERLAAFQTTVAAVVEQVRPLALHWMPSGKLIDPSAFLAAVNGSDAAARIGSALNVRMFNISNDPGVMVMDTMGMHPFGLPDVQIHFRDLEPGRVAAALYNTAIYLFDHGDVIDDGHTLDGLEKRDRWRVQHEASLVGPERIVIDLDPGPAFAAGRRGDSKTA